MGNKQTAEMGKEQISTSKMSLKLCLPLAVVLLATAIPLVGANTAAGFVFGTQGANVCPAGSVLLGTAEECESAATALSAEYKNDVNFAAYPIGCLTNAMNGYFYFNTHETGSSHTDATPICLNEPIEPSNEPTSMPSNEPTSMPLASNEPTNMPSISNEPTSMPSNEPTSMPSNEPTAYVQGPISTTCLDLKLSYQNHSCCSQDMGQAATFNGTAVTCGNVLASYKSSECCSADLAKNATMNYE